ncbi:hypothetical protein NV379_08570 [Paenibacillus sp. N1-5-1-14]|uniref:hypothetical protein n=1 Tax=Paenibacillus radicibacter TaxID=2972488 RepID=UPI002158AD1F|nr:hypothetical protein [Paenibacillus radicibacter]MCR8642715.1 hypothetical protein [Paenibacillus radicibacter]
MKKGWKVLITTGAAFLIVTSTVAASSPLPRIFFNNNEYASNYFNLDIVNDRATVSLRTLVEHLQGKVTYKDDSIYVDMPEASKVAMQLKRLESGLVAEKPEVAVETWIRGVQRRNGAMQYAVLSPALREQTKKEFEDFFWVTGGSSPHMGKVEKLNSKELSSDQVQITFDYPLIASGQTYATGSASIIVDLVNKDYDTWAISKIELKDPDDTGIMIGATKMGSK